MERQQGRRIDANVPSVVWTEANTTSAKWLWARHQNRYQLWIYCSVADLWPLERVTSRCHLISVTLSCSIPILPIPVLVIALCIFLFEVMRPKCKDIDHISSCAQQEISVRHNVIDREYWLVYERADSWTHPVWWLFFFFAVMSIPHAFGHIIISSIKECKAAPLHSLSGNSALFTRGFSQTLSGFR